MRILVCGGRDFGNLSYQQYHYDKQLKLPLEIDLAKKKNAEYDFITSQLDKLGNEFSKEKYKEEVHNGCWLFNGITIISGGAKGVDSVALDWALINWVPFEEYKADWKTYGKKAGFIRNKQMLDEGKPDLVVAFPGGKGTKMMVNIARKAGVEVREIQYESYLGLGGPAFRTQEYPEVYGQ